MPFKSGDNKKRLVKLTMEQRMEKESKKRRTGFVHHYPRHAPKLGTDIGFIFEFLLLSLQAPRQELGGLSYQSRIRPCPGASTIPAAARDVTELHNKQFAKFLDFCKADQRQEWDTLNPKQKRAVLRAWLFQKWTLDAARPPKCIKPGPGMPKKPRNDICWIGLDITDTEFDLVIEEVMTAYERHQDIIKEACQRREACH